jgi:hypothetical protein
MEDKERENANACQFLKNRVLLFRMDEKLILERLDKIISLLEDVNKQPSILVKVGNGAATGAGILGLISVIDILKTWLGG